VVGHVGVEPASHAVSRVYGPKNASPSHDNATGQHSGKPMPDAMSRGRPWVTASREDAYGGTPQAKEKLRTIGRRRLLRPTPVRAMLIRLEPVPGSPHWAPAHMA
jgi:hypothetical protein